MLSVIVPVYNEAGSVAALLARVKAVPVAKEIIVVDDGSQDGTAAVLDRIAGIVVLRHEHNRGKGAALQTGLRAARGEVVVFQDADLEYDPEDYVRLLAAAERGAPVVYGSRFRGGGEFLAASRFANRVLTFLTNVLYRGRLTDMETCYKMLHRTVIRRLRLRARRFDVEPEITAQLLRARIPIHEVPIRYRARRVGKKIGARDALQAIWTLVKYKAV